MIKTRNLSGKSVFKFFQLWQSESDLAQTLSFGVFMDHVRSTDLHWNVHWEENFCFIEESLPGGFRQLHGIFRGTSALLNLKKHFTSHTFLVLNERLPSECGSIREAVTLIRDPDLSRKAIPPEKDSLHLQEVLEVLARQFPQYHSQWMEKAVSESIASGLYRVLRDVAGKITYLHLFRPEGQKVTGIFFSSELPFSDTVRNFYEAHSLVADRPVHAIVFRDNQSAWDIHLLLGYYQTSSVAFYLSFGGT